MNNLPTRPNQAPASVVEISPEALEIANAYLQLQDVRAVADEVGVSLDLVNTVLGRREVKAYINQVFFDTGFNNRYKMRAAMDAVLRKKFQEMEEGDVGSNKDIAELLALSHKMTVELLDREIALEKLKTENTLKSQVNVQINENGDGTRYGALIAKLIGSTNADNIAE